MINVLDTETYTKNGVVVPYCICFILNNKNYSFYSSNQDDIFKYFFDVVFSGRKKKLVFFVHNLTFDGSILINWLTKINNHYKIEYESIIKNNSIYSIIIKWNNYKIHFKCSYKIMPLSLYKIAKGFNIEFYKMPYPYSAVNESIVSSNIYIPNKKDFESEDLFNDYVKISFDTDFKTYTEKYCMNDCYITKNFLEIIFNISISEGVNMCTSNVYSAPGLSLKIFLKNYNTNNVKLKYNKLFNSYIRSSYYGGRCEVFGNIDYDSENKYLYHFDFSGMYAWCLKQKFAFGNYKFENNIDNVNTPGYYHIDYTSNNMEIPILPHHHPTSKKLLFTNGSNSGIFWFEEIQLFIKNGGIVNKINSGIIFEKYDYIFKDFVEHFDTIRSKGGSYKIFSKLIVNSLYGKLGNKVHNKSTNIMSYNDYINLIKSGVEISSVVEINSMFLVTYKANSNIKYQKFGIEFAAAITSKARIRLYENLNEIKKRNGRILYMDTDSYFVEFDKNVIGENHGEVFWDDKNQDTVISDAVFIAPKIYGLKYPDNREVVKIKGIDKKNIFFDSLKNNFYNNEDSIIFNETYLKKKDLKISFVKNNKNILINSYDKRKFSVDKKKTEPYVYENGSYK